MEMHNILIVCIFMLYRYSGSVAATRGDVRGSVLDELANLKGQMLEREKFYEMKLTEVENRLYSTEGRLQYAEEEILKLRSEIDKNLGPKTSSSKQGQFTASGNGSAAKNIFIVDQRVDATESASPLKRIVPPTGSHRVAFTAHLSSTPTALGREQTIPFDRVLLNEAGAFDNVLHTFICPVNGVYMFQSALLCQENDMMQTDIVKDGIILATMYAKGTASGVFDQGFNSAVVQCNIGERVWVRAHEHQGSTLFGRKLSSFSGFMLWEM